MDIKNRDSNQLHFVVGMPRSGTKLLVRILGRHPQVTYTMLETDFLPFWIENWTGYRDLSDRAAFKRFYNSTRQIPYFLAMNSKGRLITEDVWYDSCRDYSVSGVFEAVLRHDSRADKEGKRIVIDKSPSYTRHIGLLKRHFPHSRFVHIIRDVRDYCLSVNQAWGKNMIRAAWRWNNDIQKARCEGNAMGKDYFEMTYEELLGDLRQELEKICRFIGIDFDEKMLEFKRPTEFVGDAKGVIGIKKDNVQKYERLLKPRTRRTIEGITAPVLTSLGYPVEYSGKPLTVSKGRLMFYQVTDALSLLRNSIKEKGFFGALRYNIRALISRR